MPKPTTPALPSPPVYGWEVPPEEQTLEEFMEEMEVSLCAHVEPTVPTETVREWMSALRTQVRGIERTVVQAATPTPTSPFSSNSWSQVRDAIYDNLALGISRHQATLIAEQLKRGA